MFFWVLKADVGSALATVSTKAYTSDYAMHAGTYKSSKIMSAFLDDPTHVD